MTAFLSTFHRRLGASVLGCGLAMWDVAGAYADRLEVWRSEAVPDLALPDLDGAPTRLGAEAGKIVIVHFFATWCEPCRDELRSLDRLAKSMETRRFRIFAVDVGEPGDRVRRFLERNEIAARFPVLIDFDKQVMRSWNVEILPTSYVLDGALCPLWKVTGALDWDVGDTLSALEGAVARLEQVESRTSRENCIVKGGNQ